MRRTVFCFSFLASTLTLFTGLGRITQSTRLNVEAHIFADQQSCCCFGELRIPFRFPRETALVSSPYRAAMGALDASLQSSIMRTMSLGLTQNGVRSELCSCFRFLKPSLKRVSSTKTHPHTKHKRPSSNVCIFHFATKFIYPAISCDCGRAFDHIRPLSSFDRLASMFLRG